MRYPQAAAPDIGTAHFQHVGRALAGQIGNVHGILNCGASCLPYGAVFGVFLAQLLAGKPLTIVGDGKQTRDFTYVSDAVDALITAARSNKVGEIYNVGSDRPVSVNLLVELLGAKDTVHIPKRPGEPDCTFADTKKIKRDLGWSAKVPFEEGVKIMLENIDYWRDAPVWTEESIAGATKDWFKYLGNAA